MLCYTTAIKTSNAIKKLPMLQQAAATTRPYRGLVLDTRAPPVACPRRGNRAMQIIGSTKQQ